MSLTLLTSCASVNDNITNNNNNNNNNLTITSKEKQLEFTIKTTTLDYTDDSYLTYTYPNEQLPYKLTYRKIDYYSNLLSLSNYNSQIVSLKEKESIKEFFEKFLSYYSNATFSNTIKKFDSNKSIALDTYCIIGLQLNNSKAAKNVLRHINGTNLMKNNFHKQDKWRNLADESWCIMLLKKTSTNESLSRKMLEEKLMEGETKFGKDNITNSIIVIHELLMLKEFKEFEKEKTFWKNKGYNLLKNKELAENNLILANLIDALLYFKTTNEENNLLLEKLTTLKNRQRKTGFWTSLTNETEGTGHIFTTTRVLISFEHFLSIN